MVPPELDEVGTLEKKWDLNFDFLFLSVGDLGQMIAMIPILP